MQKGQNNRQYAQIIEKYTQICIINSYYLLYNTNKKKTILIIILLYFCLNHVVLSN